MRQATLKIAWDITWAGSVADGSYRTSFFLLLRTEPSLDPRRRKGHDGALPTGARFHSIGAQRGVECLK
jgi:hypothetical protein